MGAVMVKETVYPEIYRELVNTLIEHINEGSLDDIDMRKRIADKLFEVHKATKNIEENDLNNFVDTLSQEVEDSIYFPISDYKQKIAKAIEYIKAHMPESSQFINQKKIYDMNIQDLGPLYGPVDESGLPILGQTVFKQVYTGEWEGDWPQNVLEPGFHNFTKVFVEDGQLMASGQTLDPPVTPAMWDYDDLKVVMSLVYGDPKKSHAPSFDIAATVDFTLDVMQKMWSPFWLEKTNYGKTMFCAYYWLRSFLLYPERFQICAIDEALDEGHHEMAIEVIKLLKEMKEHYKFTATDKIVMSPMDVGVTFHEELNLVELVKFEMETRVLRQDANNRYTVCEESSETFTAIYQDILMTLIPLFHRAHAITALYMCVDYLRDKGLKPADHYIEMASEEYQSYGARA